MEGMMRNKVAAILGWEDIITDFIIVKKKKRVEGDTGMLLLMRERHVAFGGETTLA